MDRWRIDDEWWRAEGRGQEVCRAEISRMYYHVALANRQLLVIFQDLIEGSWYAQTAATPLQQPDPVHVLASTVAATSAAAARKVGVSLRSIGAA